VREATIVAAIQKTLRSRGAWVLKTHGESMQLRGIPDLIVCYRGLFFGLEVKVPGESATAIQQYALDEIAAAGGTAATVHSVSEALSVLDKAAV